MMEGLLSVPVLQPMEPSRDPWGGGGAAGSPALLHLGGRCSVLLQSSTPGPGEREMLSPLPSPSSSAPCAHTAATWRPGWLPAAHRGRTVPVLQLPWGQRALHPGDLTDGVEWMGGCWPRCSFRCDERSCGDAMSHRWERVPPQWVALGGGGSGYWGPCDVFWVWGGSAPGDSMGCVCRALAAAVRSSCVLACGGAAPLWCSGSLESASSPG